MKIRYDFMCLASVPTELKHLAVPKDYGVCEDTGKSLVMYSIYTDTLSQAQKFILLQAIGETNE